MDKRLLVLPVTLDGYNSKADGSTGVKFTTSIETDGDCIKDIHSFKKKIGWLLFSENEIQDKDIPIENAPSEGKSQSKRLHDVLYVYWHALKEKGDTQDDFNKFYNRKTEKIIEHFKEKLPELK